tara:strand:+ start:2820 stop:4190 length:1371 start_codon:yes stop_codon:yes gene_type:complete
MSAGGINYDMVLPRRAVTLPSVETWGTNMNILKDPPKGIFTRRIDKVGDTQEITYDIDGAGDRICEMIQVYPRGVNPMVAVSYSNNGTNGGQVRDVPTRNGSVLASNCTAQASLPYKAFDNGAFRPPVRRQEDLLPLSRMPRVWTYTTANKAFPNYAQKMECHPEQKKSLLSEAEVLRSSIRPTATYSIGVDELHELKTEKYVVDDILIINANSGTRTLDNTQLDVQKPSKVINDITTIETFTNINGGGKAENHQINTDKYTKDAMNIAANSGMYLKNGNRQKDVLDTRQFIKSPLTGEVNTGIYLKKNTRNDLDTSRMIKTPLNVSATSGIAKSSQGGEYIHSQLSRTHNRPVASARTNTSGLTKNNQDNRVIVLEKEILKHPITINRRGLGCANRNRKTTVIPRRTLQKGSFIRDNYGKISNDRVNQVFNNNIKSERQLLHQKANNTFFQRYSS